VAPHGVGTLHAQSGGGACAPLQRAPPCSGHACRRGGGLARLWWVNDANRPSVGVRSHLEGAGQSCCLNASGPAHPDHWVAGSGRPQLALRLKRGRGNCRGAGMQVLTSNIHARDQRAARVGVVAASVRFAARRRCVPACPLASAARWSGGFVKGGLPTGSTQTQYVACLKHHPGHR
jgi:hypothetical protein